MKINVVKDKSGKIVATFETGSGSAATTLTPVLQDGEKVEQLEVPENYRENLGHIYSGKAS